MDVSAIQSGVHLWYIPLFKHKVWYPIWIFFVFLSFRIIATHNMLRANFNEQSLLEQKYNSDVICLHGPCFRFTLENYTASHETSTSILIHKTVHHTPLWLSTHSSATAVRVTKYQYLVCVYTTMADNLTLARIWSTLFNITSGNCVQ